MREFEAVVLEDPLVQSIREVSDCLAWIGFVTWKLLDKIGFPYRRSVHFAFSHRQKRLLECEGFFVALFGPDIRKISPYFFLKARKWIYLFDAWPSTYRNVLQLVSAAEVEHVFLSSSKAAKDLSALGSTCRFSWVPEGVDSRQYTFKDFAEKSIDVLHFGRGYPRYDDQVSAELGRLGFTFLRGTTSKPYVFQTRDDFRNGLARTKISICIPRSFTNPSETGGSDAETMTARYLQSMASKCLIVGHAPKEMIDLFGYNPIVEIDWARPCNQLVDVLLNFNEYIPLIERNHCNVWKSHQWEHRLTNILARLEETSRES